MILSIRAWIIKDVLVIVKKTPPGALIDRFSAKRSWAGSK
jgi:hypothetical protein